MSDKELATPELIDKVAKNIMRSRMLDLEYFTPIYKKFDDKKLFQEQFELAINSVWDGAEAHDAVERSKYRRDAVAALAVLGYHVELDEIETLLLV